MMNFAKKQSKTRAPSVDGVFKRFDKHENAKERETTTHVLQGYALEPSIFIKRSQATMQSARGP